MVASCQFTEILCDGAALFPIALSVAMGVIASDRRPIIVPDPKRQIPSDQAALDSPNA
jgi:hypothetical protein